jgi:hypothetical protein
MSVSTSGKSSHHDGEDDAVQAEVALVARGHLGMQADRGSVLLCELRNVPCLHHWRLVRATQTMRCGIARSSSRAGTAAPSPTGYYRTTHTNARFLLFRIPLVANKLTSASALSSVGYNKFPLCNAPGVAADTDRSWWNQGLDALHGEDHVDVSATFPLMVGADVFCTTLCELDDAQRFQSAILQEFHYNWLLGGLPVAVRTEDEYVCDCEPCNDNRNDPYADLLTFIH